MRIIKDEFEPVLLTVAQFSELAIIQHLRFNVGMHQWVRGVVLISQRWELGLGSKSACAPLEMVYPSYVPSIHYSPGKETDALDGEECIEDLSADLYPEPLEEGVKNGCKALATLLTCRYGSCKSIHLARKSTIAAPQNTTRTP